MQNADNVDKLHTKERPFIRVHIYCRVFLDAECYVIAENINKTFVSTVY